MVSVDQTSEPSAAASVEPSPEESATPQGAVPILGEVAPPLRGRLRNRATLIAAAAALTVAGGTGGFRHRTPDR
jgi:hypothetical protein